MTIQVQVGKAAPEIYGTAYLRGQSDPIKVRPADLRGRWLVLVFYPRDFSVICPGELKDLSRLHVQFHAEDTTVLAASTDSYFSHKSWFESDYRLQRVMFPVIADTAHRLSAAFGVLSDDGSAQRATFIVDPDGILRHAEVNDDDMARNLEETLRRLRALRENTRCATSQAA